MAFTVQFYTNLSDVDTVNKNITTVGNPISCNIQNEKDIEHPTITFPLSAINILGMTNYFFITEFNRYYFIDSYKQLIGGIVEIIGTEDYLSSHWNKIKDLDAIIEKQEHLANMYVVDNDLQLQTRSEQKILKWTTPLSNGGTTNVLIVAGSATDDD